MSLGSCAAVLKTASRANPALHLPYRPRGRATPRFASRNYRRYDWMASSGSVVDNDPVDHTDPTGNDCCYDKGGYHLPQTDPNVSAGAALATAVKVVGVIVGLIAAPEVTGPALIANGIQNGVPPVASPASSAVNAVKLEKSLASEAQVAEITAGKGTSIAGKGSDKAFRDSPRLAAQNRDKASDYSKVTSKPFQSRDGTKFETHAVQNTKTGEVMEFKTKIYERKKE